MVSGTDSTPAELGFSVAAGNRAYLSLQLQNAAFSGWEFPQIHLNNGYAYLVSANGSTFIYEVVAVENLPADTPLIVNLSYQQFDANQNVIRDIGVYDTLTNAFNNYRMASVATVLVDTAECSGSSSSASSNSSDSSSSVTSSSSSSSPSVICEAQTGADAGTANLGFGMMAGQNFYMSLQVRNADYTSPIQVSLENAIVYEVFGAGNRRIFQVSAQQNIPSSTNFQFDYGYQQVIANQSVWRDVAVHDNISFAINGILPLTVSNTLLVDASNCAQ